MPFSVTTLTSKGTELLAAATVSDRLIIVGCDADTTQLNQTQAQAIQTRPVSPTCTTTDVTSLSVASDHITCRIYFNSTDSTGGDVKSLYLYGYLESAPSDIYVIYVVSNSTTFHLPTSSDVINEWEGKLDIVYTISPDSVGFATLATYCSVSEFNLLKNRVVTTHSENSTTHGEDQDIYGYKTFKETVTHEDSLEMFSNINFQNEDNTHGIYFTISESPETSITSDETGGGTIYIDAVSLSVRSSLDVTGSVTLQAPINSDVTITGNLTASSSHKTATFNTVVINDQLICKDVVGCWDNITFENEDNIHGIYFTISELPETSITSDESDGGTIYISAPNVKFNEFSIDLTQSSSQGGHAILSFPDQVNSPVITFSGHDDLNIGSSMDLYAHNLGITGVDEVDIDTPLVVISSQLTNINNELRLVNPDNDHYVAVKCSEDAFMVYNDIVTAYTQSSSRTNLGRNTRPFNEVWAVAFQLASTYSNVCIFEDDGDIVLQPASGGAVSINYMNCSGMYGLAPHLNSSTLSLAIGGFIDVWSSELASIQSVIHAGEQITIPANTVYTVKLDGSTGNYVRDSYTIPAGKYRALMGMDMTTSTYHNFITLVRET